MLIYYKFSSTLRNILVGKRFKALVKHPQKDERPHIAAFPFGASFSLLASRAHIPIR
jgi:hypothetical protein